MPNVQMSMSKLARCQCLEGGLKLMAILGVNFQFDIIITGPIFGPLFNFSYYFMFQYTNTFQMRFKGFEEKGFLVKGFISFLPTAVCHYLHKLDG